MRPPTKRARMRIGVAVAVVALVWVAWAMWWTSLRAWVGEPSGRIEERWHVGHRIVDRNGVLLRELATDEGRRGRELDLDAIGPRLVAATLTAEDDEFFEHDGIDRVAILRAAEQNLRHRRLVSGASTISQQLVKLLDTRGETQARTLQRKLTEAARAQNLETVLTKDDILVAYLNRLPYGHGLVGPEAAAMGYFGVHSHDLSWAQATVLAVLPRAPSYLDPYRHLERVVSRQRALLQAMHETGHIDAAQLQRALTEPIELRPLSHPFGAPHLIQTLRAEGRLGDGSVTRTTLDATLQRDIEGLVRTHMSKMAERGANDAAAVVIDNATGDVLAYVGSTDFHDPEISGQVDMVRSPRQPGSTLKPFVYALAFAKGHTGAQMLADVPTEFVESGGEVYAPDNFHGDFVGPISAREALAASLNVPVVRLAQQLGVDAVLEQLRALGLTDLQESERHYGLSIALGSGEVQLRALAEAYVALARGGEAVSLRYRVDEPPATPRPVLDPAVAAAVTEALADPLARARLLDGRSPFEIGYPLALKTGTSSGYRDAWTVGFSHERTVAIWVGNADGSGMRGVTGAGGAGPLFADIMRRAMADVSTRAPLWDPDLLVTADVCPLTGKRPVAACPHAVSRRFVAADVPDEPCDAHVQAHREGDRFTCAHGPGSHTESIAILPPAFDAWLDRFAFGAPGKDPHGLAWVSAHDAPTCRPGYTERPLLRVTAPTTGSVIWRDPQDPGRDRVQLRALLEGTATAVEEVEFVVDGQVVAKSRAPFEALVALPPGDHEVLARPVDPDRPMGIESAMFSVR